MQRLFSSPDRRAHQLAHQEEQLDRVSQIAEHSQATHHILEEVQEALQQADPNLKYSPETLDPSTEVIVRYEGGRWRYAICTTEANCMVTAVWAGKSWTITYVNPGWQALDYPPGTRLYSGDANRHFIIARMSNLKV